MREDKTEYRESVANLRCSEDRPTSFVDLLCFCSVLCLLCLYASVYMCFVVTCWERADLLALVCGVFCEFVTFPLVSWVRCGT